MKVPTLEDLAADIVAVGIVEGIYSNVDYRMRNALGNKIFRKICKIKGIINFKLANRLMGKLYPTNVDLSEYMLEEWNIPMLKNLNLDTLKLGGYAKLKDYIRERRHASLKHKRERDEEFDYVCRPHKNTKYIDIISLLKDILNSRTRKNLVEFDVNLNEFDKRFPFSENWTKTVGKMLPSLQILRFSGRRLSRTGFLSLCRHFPNLHTLDISATGISNLNGISKLKNLEELSIGGLVLKQDSDIKDLFNLKKLKTLNLSEENKDYCENCPRKTIELFAKSEKSLQGLEYLDCFLCEHFNDELLDQIVRKHPKLIKVVANHTAVVRTEMPGVELFTSNSIESMIHSLIHFTTIQKNESRASHPLICLSRFLRQNFRNRIEVQSELYCTAIKQLYNAMCTFDTGKAVTLFGGYCCFEFTRERLFNSFGDTEKVMIIDCMLMVGTFYLKYPCGFLSGIYAIVWKNINKVLMNAPTLNFDKVCSKAMEMMLFVNGEERDKWEIICLEVIEKSLTKINTSSKFYQKINMEKLVRILREMHSRQGLEDNYKVMAGNVMQFIQQSFF